MSSVNPPNTHKSAPATQSATNKAYWRSLEDYADTPEFRKFVEREFPGHEAIFTKGPNRRNFLKIMGASLAMAGLTSCRWPKEEILPFASRPESFLPGTSRYYATSFELAGTALGLLVASYDGRPIKCEGNPEHPSSLGATDAIAQASVLGVYDPDRSTGLRRRTQGQTLSLEWTDFSEYLRTQRDSLSRNGGTGLRVLAEPSASLTQADMKARFRRAYPNARWHTWSPVLGGAERAGAEAAFGRPYRTHYAFDQAHAMVFLDADVLHEHPNAVRYARDFIRSRHFDDNGWMSKVFALETTMSVTGTMADYRYPLRPTNIRRAALGLALELGQRGLLRGGSVNAAGANLAALREQFPFISTIADTIEEAHRAGHPSVVVAGPRQPAAVHQLAHQLNAWLGNVGKTVHYSEDLLEDTGAESIRALVRDMKAGQVETLVILGGNPVYDAPADLDFPGALARVANSMHLSLYVDETSAQCTWHLPQAHYLESWGDARGWDGTAGIVQPLIEPLYQGKSALEILALLSGDELTRGYDLVRRAVQRLAVDEDFETFWKRSLHDGVIQSTRLETQTPTLGRGTPDLSVGADEGGDFEIVFLPDPKVYDGRFANNGWLQELPATLTKIAWDNAVLLSPRDANRLGIRHADMVAVRVHNATQEMPVYVMPGHAAGAATVYLGYGREVAGRVGDKVGFNVYPLRTSDSLGIGHQAQIEKTGAAYELATTQDHHAIDAMGLEGMEDRLDMLVREATVDAYTRYPHMFEHMGPHHPPLKSLWESHKLTGEYQWGMAVDLNSCIGCNACVMACQAENNIAVVGKEEVAYGREMHWLRIDRYFSGAPEKEEEIKVSYQPVMCQHCENAPCEPVCPVAATVHDQDGLNVMVYNRCIGTRYCSNNCPFKVRRFNYFANEEGLTQTEKMVHNPEVTVRGRGVMEKCTFCVQRISKAKIEAKNNNRPVRDGEFTTACAQACPTQAIVFGDVSDPDTRVSRLIENNRAYAMLQFMNIRPRVHYLGRLRNMEPTEAELKQAAKYGSHGGGHGDDPGDEHGAEHGDAHGDAHGAGQEETRGSAH